IPDELGDLVWSRIQERQWVLGTHKICVGEWGDHLQSPWILDPSGIPPWRRTFGDESAKALATPSKEFVPHVDERRQSQRAKDAAERSSKPNLSKQQDAPAPVPSDRRPIAEYEPPTFAALFVRHRGEEAFRLFIVKRKQGQFFAAVERGDDPRRPATEPSTSGIKQDRARQVRGSVHSRSHVLRPSGRKTMPHPGADAHRRLW
ncbi:MAG: hypothetical protein ACRD1X_07420, partial [Vicinamibacteria bacterium]